MRAVTSALRGYWVGAALGLAAIVLLIVGAPTRAALVGAGFAFAGAAVTRAVDVASEHRTAAAKADADRRRDLDETRRLAYAMIAKPVSQPNPVLIASLVNALAHHGLGVDALTAMKHLAEINRGRIGESHEWLLEQIERITKELEG